MAPTRRYNKRSRNYAEYLALLQRAKATYHSGRLPSALKKATRVYSEIDTLVDEQAPHTGGPDSFIQGPDLFAPVSDNIQNFGFQGRPASNADIDVGWSEQPTPPPPDPMSHLDHHTDENPFMTLETYNDIVVHSDKKKVCGALRVPTRALAHCNDDMKAFLHNVLLQFHTKPFPLLLETEIILLHKKGCPFSLKNYRPISLTTCLYRVYTTWLQTHLVTHLEPLLHPSQGGFLPQRQTD